MFGRASLASISSGSPSACKVRFKPTLKHKMTPYPAIQLLKNRVSTLIEHSFKEDRSNHDGYSESRRSPEERLVDEISQRHVGGGLRWTGCYVINVGLF